MQADVCNCFSYIPERSSISKCNGPPEEVACAYSENVLGGLHNTSIATFCISITQPHIIVGGQGTLQETRESDGSMACLWLDVGTNLDRGRTPDCVGG